MKIEGYIPARDVEMETKGKEITVFYHRFPHAVITAIDGKEVAGVCESCGEPIFSDEKYNHDEDGVRWHVDCPKSA